MKFLDWHCLEKPILIGTFNYSTNNPVVYDYSMHIPSEAKNVRILVY